MTTNKNFKQLVRARMLETGQNYTAARADLVGPDEPQDASPAPPSPSPSPAELEHRKVVGRFVVDGRLVSFPARRKVRAHVLLHLVGLFEPGRDYDEREVNQVLLTVVDDQAFWRRELVNHGYLHREGGRYWLTDEVPERTGNLAQEVPDWEREWLPRHIARNG